MGKKIVAGVIIMLVLLGVGATVGRSWMHANSMRSKIYGPLHKEVVTVEEVVLASNVNRAVPSTVYISLKKDPLWQEVPEELRKSVDSTYEKVWDCQSEMVVARSHAAGMAAINAMLVRTEADDQAWIKRVTAANPAPGKGQRLRREPEIDRTDPAHPRLKMPGGPVWRLTDWLEYPDNIAELDKEWGDNEFLFLREVASDNWQGRVTRDDLRRAKLTLEQFMASLNRSIESYGRIQSFRQHCRVAIPMVAALKKQLEEKIQ